MQRLEDESGEDLPKYILKTVSNRLLEKEMDKQLQAEKYERTEKRSGHRNGYRERKLYTRVGTLELRVPRDRDGNFSTEIFNKFQRSEKALVLTLQQMYLDGVSTRKTKKITEKLCGTSFSKDQVSRLTKQLDDQLEEWRNRPLDGKDDNDNDGDGDTETERDRETQANIETETKTETQFQAEGGEEEDSGVSFPYLAIDAIYEKVREGGRIRDRAVLLVMGIDEEGYRQFLGTYMKASESEPSWREVFYDLIERGLDPESVKYVISDKHLGMVKAVGKCFPQASWQWCQTHFQRNARSRITGKEEKDKLHQHLRDVFNSPNEETARARSGILVDHYAASYPRLAWWLEEGLEETLAVFALPKAHRKRLRTNNGLERFNGEIKRRTKVVRIFPNRESCLRLVSALCMEQSEEWITGRRYVNKDDLQKFLEELKEEEEGVGADTTDIDGELDLQQEVVFT